METLTSREYAETIGCLQIFRDKIIEEKGYEPKDVVSALEKITKGCKPNTVGMRFELTHADEAIEWLNSAVRAVDEFTRLIDDMIEEVQGRQRKYTKPLMGGAHQAHFDGEELGRFIRFCILMEVRDRVTGEQHNEKDILNMFRENA